MALDPTIRAFNRAKHRLGQLVPEVLAVVSALRHDADAFAAAQSTVLEHCEELLSTLARVVAVVDDDLERLWQRQPQRRLRYRNIHHQKMRQGAQ